jgi:hypothetical protein
MQAVSPKKHFPPKFMWDARLRTRRLHSRLAASIELTSLGRVEPDLNMAIDFEPLSLPPEGLLSSFQALHTSSGVPSIIVSNITNIEGP